MVHPVTIYHNTQKNKKIKKYIEKKYTKMVKCEHSLIYVQLKKKYKKGVDLYEKGE